MTGKRTVQMKMRGNSVIDIQSLLYRAVELQLLNPHQYPYKNCLNCMKFNAETEICKIANARPPAIIIVAGCPQHDDINEIPF